MKKIKPKRDRKRGKSGYVPIPSDSPEFIEAMTLFQMGLHEKSKKGKK